MEKFIVNYYSGAAAMSRYLATVFVAICISLPALALPGSAATREASEFIIAKFGKGAAGNSIDEVSQATIRAVEAHGEEALGFLRAAGHSGFVALTEAGELSPELIKFFARKGDDAIWVISDPKKLSIFLKHGDSGAEALLKHPGIADNLIERFGEDAVTALNSISRQNAQRLSIMEREGVLTATPQSAELLTVIRRYGDEAMDFIWKNKGSLTVATILASFIKDPQAYMSGFKDLVVDPIVVPIVSNTNWSLIIAGILFFVFLPKIARSIRSARSTLRETKPDCR